MSTREILADVLVIGGGVGGCIAAIKAREAGAKKVLLVCKATAGSSGSAMYMAGNIRDYEVGEAKTISSNLAKSCRYMCDQEWLEDSIGKSQERMLEFKKWGVKFVRVGKEDIRTGMGSSYGGEANTNFWVDGGPTQFLWTLRSQAARSGTEIIDRFMITDLLTSDGKNPTKGQVVGAVGFDVRSGEFQVFKAKATVLASGRWSIPRRDTPDQTADGQAMAIRAGATLRCMDLIEFAIPSLLGNATANDLAFIYAAFGAKQTNRLHPDWTRENFRTVLDIERAREAKRLEKKDIPSAESYGSPVWDDGWSGNFRDCTAKQLLPIVKNCPRYLKILEKLGLNMLEDDLPAARFPFEAGNTGSSGGLRINRNHETTIPGLFAAGDVADRIGYRGLGLSGAAVGGAIAGMNASKYEAGGKESKIVPEQVEQFRKIVFANNQVKDGIRPFRLRNKLIEAVCDVISENGFMTNEERLKKSISKIEGLKVKLPELSPKDPHELMKINELRNLLQVFPLGFKAFMWRKESRFLPREDYPERDDKNWLKFLNFKMKEDKTVDFWAEDIPMKTG